MPSLASAPRWSWLMAAAWIGVLADTPPGTKAETLPPTTALDTLVRVGDHELYFEVQRGTVPLTIVLESGGGSDLTAWGEIPAMLAVRTGATVVAYDRAGLGRSSLPPGGGRSPTEEIDDLRTALGALAVPEKTIVVGASYGAMLALLDAGRESRDVVGVVLVDPMNPRFIRATGDFIYTTVPAIPAPETDRERVIARMVETMPGLTEDVAAIEPGLSVPMAIISAGVPWWGRPEIDAAWRRSHEDMANARTARTLLIADGATHGIAQERPDVVVNGVQWVVQRVVPR